MPSIDADKNVLPKVKCDICQKEITNLSRHVRLMHRNVKDVKENIACEICHKVIQKEHLKRHKLIHEDTKLKCETCGRSYTNLMSFQRHKKVHEINDACFQCGKKFI